MSVAKNELADDIIACRVIDVKNGEIPICEGDFFTMLDAGSFVRHWVDSDDSIKLCGVTAEGDTYVSQKDCMRMTDEEERDWSWRCEKKFGPCELDIATDEDIREYEDMIKNKGTWSF